MHLSLSASVYAKYLVVYDSSWAVFFPVVSLISYVRLFSVSLFYTLSSFITLLVKLERQRLWVGIHFARMCFVYECIIIIIYASNGGLDYWLGICS